MGLYTVVRERRDGRRIGEPLERVSHTGHPRAGEEMRIDRRLYRVHRVCHDEVPPDDSISPRWRWTSPTVHVRPLRPRPRRKSPPRS